MKCRCVGVCGRGGHHPARLRSSARHRRPVLPPSPSAVVVAAPSVPRPRPPATSAAARRCCSPRRCRRRRSRWRRRAASSSSCARAASGGTRPPESAGRSVWPPLRASFILPRARVLVEEHDRLDAEAGDVGRRLGHGDRDELRHADRPQRLERLLRVLASPSDWSARRTTLA